MQFNVVTPKYGDTCSAEDSFEEEEAANHFQATHATTCPRPPNTSPTTMLQRSVAELAGAPLSGPPAFHELPEIWTKIASFLGARALGHLACTALRFRAVLSTCVSTSASKALDEYGRTGMLLHDAVRQQDTSLALVQVLLKAYPEAVQRCEKITCHGQGDNCGEEFEVPGRLLLHVAVQNGAAVEVVKALLEVYPKAAQTSDNEVICIRTCISFGINSLFL
mmetsp:Transcript_21147/g.30997  ORF Transcript_21147/g.30997 Transcript_21147/m.30997 type:complete len:222 (+) Transcript_21147:466-1131(+)